MHKLHRVFTINANFFTLISAFEEILARFDEHDLNKDKIKSLSRTSWTAEHISLSESNIFQLHCVIPLEKS